MALGGVRCTHLIGGAVRLLSAAATGQRAAGLNLKGSGYFGQS
ncbi:hypothetical protein PF008_g23067 [Phytophthora fragariae]|uniref:Uncharacterized protein n=1 Tax=Phytophthora fragariae TaxID=53985 RepID=A0A6G0QS27_9STRA|nr:hypothetical protein PF008_g23067 [Phytophthora fragariae]